MRSLTLMMVCKTAIDIRLHAVHNYGRVIHEFDPWFNFRATEQLVHFQEQYGWFGGIQQFNKWFDNKVWSPLGRPVGTTIYPGMQFTSAAIYKVANYTNAGSHLHFWCEKLDVHLSTIPVVGPSIKAMEIRRTVCEGFKSHSITLNDVCVFVPAYFGAITSMLVYLLASEISGSTNIGTVAAAIMAVLPAHLMRSVGVSVAFTLFFVTYS
jgi:dolichyl-diphosphooligosaccharide--protein glycosyltransferase